SGSYEDCDIIITVTAPEKVRLERVMKRDGSGKDRVMAIMKNQFSDEERIPRSDYVISNSDLDKTRQQVNDIHAEILKMRE
ncbi:MAG: dephospho-CoA kinase, partial [Bacteroidia bacterium]|nr:dephospho-CoA kinase [Bacteroidia bacterium]